MMNIQPESKSALVFAYVACFLFGLSLWYCPPHDPDLGWHLFGGAYISENGFPDFDPVNSFNSFWLNYHWLAQVLLFKLYQAGGFTLLKLVFGTVMGLQAMLVFNCARLASKNRVTIVAALFISFFFVLFVSLVSSIRPQSFAALGLLLALRILLVGGRFELPLLFFLSVLLVNVHIYWVLIPLMWVVIRLIPQLRAKNSFSLTYVVCAFLIFALIPFISPYGAIAPMLFKSWPFGYLGNYVLLYEYIFSPSLLSEMISEFRGGLSEFNTNYYCLLVLLAWFIFSIMSDRLTRNTAYKLLAFCGIVLALNATKFIMIAAIFCIPYLAVSLAEFFPLRIAERRVTLLSVAAAFTICAVVNPWNTAGGEIIREQLPVDLCAKLSAFSLKPLSPRNHVRILTHFDHGGWCRWALYQENKEADYRVTTDGRTQFVSPEFLMSGFDLYRLRKNWLSTLRKWDPDIIIAAVDWPISQFLFYTQGVYGWKLAERDAKFAVFVRANKES